MAPADTRVTATINYQMIQSIQFLRAVAALMVVYYHATVMVSDRGGYGTPVTNSGSAGVDIFFVISGFVIFLITARKPRRPVDFLVRRVIRVGPPYWFYTSAAVAVLCLAPTAYKTLEFDLSFVASSYAFLLATNNLGAPGTVLGVGWTMAYEMYFYMLFTAALVLTPRSPLRTVAPAILLGAALSFYLHDIPAVAYVATHTLPLEFLAGCLLARAYLSRRFLPQSACWPLFALAIGALWWVGHAGMITDAFSTARVLFFGLPAVALVYSVVSLDALGRLKFPRIALFVGGSSYSLYLCHKFVLFVVAELWVSVGLTSVPSIVLLLAGIAAAVCVGAISYLILEKPVIKRLNHMWFG